MLNGVGRGQKAFAPFAGQHHEIGNHHHMAHTEAEMQAVREAGNAMAIVMEKARSVLEAAEIDMKVLAPDERLLSDLQAIYLKHDQAVEALTSSTAAVQAVLRKKINKKIFNEVRGNPAHTLETASSWSAERRAPGPPFGRRLQPPGLTFAAPPPPIVGSSRMEWRRSGLLCSCHKRPTWTPTPSGTLRFY